MDYKEFGPCGTSLAFADEAEFSDKISRVDTSVPARTEGRQSWHRERYCIVPYLSYLHTRRLLEFPLEVLKAESPDFELRFHSGFTAGIEHADFGTEQYQQVLTITEGLPDPTLIEDSHFDLDENPEKIARALKRRGEPLDGPGWAGDEPEQQWAELVNRAIQTKTDKLNNFDFRVQSHNELLLYDNSHVASAVQVEPALRILAEKIGSNAELLSQPRQFDAISVIHGSEVFGDILSNVTFGAFNR